MAYLGAEKRVIFEQLACEGIFIIYVLFMKNLNAVRAVLTYSTHPPLPHPLSATVPFVFKRGQMSYPHVTCITSIRLAGMMCGSLFSVIRQGTCRRYYTRKANIPIYWVEGEGHICHSSAAPKDRLSIFSEMILSTVWSHLHL